MACGIHFGDLQILDWDDEGLTIVQAKSYFFAWWHQRDVRDCHVSSKEVDDTLHSKKRGKRSTCDEPELVELYTVGIVYSKVNKT